MTPECILLILLSAAMHVGWNLICKAQRPSGAYFLLASISSALLLVPVALCLSPLLARVPAFIWLLIAMTGLVQALYYIGLGNAYRLCEVSIAYPLARALPVLLIPAVLWLLELGVTIPGAALGGMGLIAVGCASVSLSRSKAQSGETRSRHTGFLFIFLAALGTTGYTIIDSHALGQLRALNPAFTPAHTALLYIAVSNVFIIFYMSIYSLSFRRERETLRALIARKAWQPFLGGIACTISYTLILAAMMFASDVSYVAAFRQVSIPIGALCGIWIFKEHLSIRKLTGVAFVFVGLVVVALY